MTRVWKLVMCTVVGFALATSYPAQGSAGQAPCPVGTGAQSDSFGAGHKCSDSGDGGTITGTADDGTTYSYSPVCEKDYGDVDPTNFAGCTGQMECGESGIMYEVTTTPLEGEPTTETKCLETPKRRPGEREVYNLFKEVPLPKSDILVQPPGGRTLVNFKTLMSTQAVDFVSKPVTLRDHTVVFTITADQFRWRHGDGTEQTTDWPGRKWKPNDDPSELINHIYVEKTSGLEVSVDTTWSATWTLNGKDQGAVEGTVTIEGDSVELAVVEAVPQLVTR